MAQQTAVIWLQQALYNHLTHEQHMQFEGLFQQAKAMEKEQIINACEHFAEYPFDKNDFEDYYNETYNK